ncbi:MAG: peptidyl-prolyl cis-trans isomerase [candidate division WOR-3 bacterium]
MISKLRKRVKVIMFIVAFAFVGGFLLSEVWQLLRAGRFSRSPLQKGILGYVGKKPITFTEYQNVYNYLLYRTLREKNAKDISEEERLALENQTWQYLVQEKNWEEVLKKAGITVTGQEIYEVMKANPPQELLEKPELKDSLGNFDYQKYLALLQSRENQEYFALYARELLEVLPKEKFRIDVKSSFRVTSGEVEERASLDNKKVRVSYIKISPYKFSESQEKPSERELRDYYEKNKKDFEIKPSATLKCLVFPVRISPADSEEAKKTIEDAYRQLQGGEDFVLTIMDFSDNPQDTFSFWLKFSQIDTNLTKLIKGVPISKFSNIFQRGDTYQIIKVEQVEKDSAKIKRITSRIKLSSSTLAAIYDSMRTFIEKAEVDGFDTVAKSYGLSPIPLPPLVKGRGLSWPRLASPSQLEWFAFNSKPGSVSQPLRGWENEYYIFHLEKLEKGQYRPFEQVKSIIEFRVKREKDKKKLKEYAQKVYDKVLLRRSLEEVAKEESLEYQTKEFNSFQICRQTEGPEFAGAAYALEPGELAPLIITDWAAFIILSEGKEERKEGEKFDWESFLRNRAHSFTEQIYYEFTKIPEVKDFRASGGRIE